MLAGHIAAALTKGDPEALAATVATERQRFSTLKFIRA